MTKAEESRIFWNSILLIVATVLPLFLVLTAGAVTGNRATGMPFIALLIILLLVVLRRTQLRLPPNGGALSRSFDTPLVACIAAGAFIGFLLTFVASIRSYTELPSGIKSSTQLGTVTPVTSTYSVFGVAVAESTGPGGADSSRRFTQFDSIVGLAFVTLGMVVGLVVYLVGFRQRGRAVSEPSAVESTVG